MKIYQIDPTQDPRWVEFIGTHPKASIFHSVAWLTALRLTYGYEPVAFTTSPPTGKLINGIVFCRVKSWLTGHRLVSLPFSDYCEPLCDTAQDLSFLVRYLQTAMDHQEWRYLEIRPVDANLGRTDDGINFLPAATHYLHTVDLCPDLEAVFKGLDKDSVQRRVKRAQGAALVEKCGRSDDLLKDFYALFVTTRRRHRIPPSPLSWFRNLARCQGEALQVRLAYKDGTPIAAIITLQFRDTVYFKYGCSDARFNKFGAIPLLLWNAIAAAKSSRATTFDMGRTEDSDAGLLAFKSHWDRNPKTLIYWRYPDTASAPSSDKGWKARLAKSAFSHMPNGLLTITGELLYRHIG
jgi:hypothetical protein